MGFLAVVWILLVPYLITLSRWELGLYQEYLFDIFGKLLWSSIIAWLYELIAPLLLVFFDCSFLPNTTLKLFWALLTASSIPLISYLMLNSLACLSCFLHMYTCLCSCTFLIVISSINWEDSTLGFFFAFRSDIEVYLLVLWFSLLNLEFR